VCCWAYKNHPSLWIIQIILQERNTPYIIFCQAILYFPHLHIYYSFAYDKRIFRKISWLKPVLHTFNENIIRGLFGK
jgi:hypothetical protein